MLQVQEPKRGGMVIGPGHNPDGTPGGGVHFVLDDTGKHIEEEGFEINIPRELRDSKEIHTFRGNNARILDQILNLAGLSLSDKVTNVLSRDIVICVRSAWDTTERTLTGTVEEILHQINTSNGCKPILKEDVRCKMANGIAKNGGKLPKGVKPRVKDWQAEDPNSPRWKKKRARIQELSNSIHRLRLNVSRDLQSDDERTALTALVIAVMDRSAERIGNDDSADNGHFGVTGFRKKHITVVGNKTHLEYVGKSGTKHDKSISDLRISKALKKAIKNAPAKFIFETSDGFRVKSDKVNRYLEPFNISAKDLRGYNANRWIIEQLKKQDGSWQLFEDNKEKARKERKKIFNKAVKETALRVGHGAATLKKHYMIPELPIEYIEHGRIIDMKNIGYHRDGGPLGDLKSEDYFANKSVVPDIVNKKTDQIHLESQDEGIDKVFNSQVVKEIDWKDVIPTQDFLRSSKFAKLKTVDDIYSIHLPWAIEYNGKYYINDGHHRVVEMHERNLPIKVHAYPIESTTMKSGSEVAPYMFPVIEDAALESLKGGGSIEKVLWGTKKGDPDWKEQLITEDESQIEKARAWAEANGFDRLRVSTIDLTKVPDFTKTIRTRKMEEGGATASTEEKIAQRLQERQKSKEFKDTGIATYTRKYHAAYDIVTSSDLADIEKDNVTAYKLIEKSKIWPLYNVNELREQGNSSGAAYLKVKCREFLSARPLDTKEARAVYVKNIEKLRSGLEPLKKAFEVSDYLKQFANLDTFDLGDISSFSKSYWVTSSYQGNLAKYNEKQVQEYFNDIFGKKFYNFCLVKSDPARKIFAEAYLFEAYTKAMRQAYVDKSYRAYQDSLKKYSALRDKVQAADEDDVKKLVSDSGIGYYEYNYEKKTVMDWLNKYIAFYELQNKETVDTKLSKIHTVREEDWSWSGAEKKETAPKDEEGKPRKPQNIFEKYGIETPKSLKRTPLEFIKRTGGLAVGDVSTKAVLDNYGFKNIIYGNYVNDAESKEHTKHILGAMLDMVELANIDIKDINKLGGLDINIGSTGCGAFSKAAACYFPQLKAINLTKKRGDGSLGHEWSHYLDNILAEGTEKKATNILYGTLNPAKSERVTMLFAEYKNWLMNGGTARKIKVTYYPQKKFLYRVYGETLPEAIEGVQKRHSSYKEYKNFNSSDLIKYYGYLAYKLNKNEPIEVELETKATDFWIATSRFVPSDYYLSPKEMFARAFEGWLEYKLEKMGRANNYLVDIKSGMGFLALLIPRNEWCYPFGEDVIWLNDWFERLFSAIRVDYGIKPFTWGTKERVDEYTDYKETTNEKVDSGVQVSSDGEVTVIGGQTEEFEKGYAFRLGTLKDAKGENRHIHYLITIPYSRGRGFAVGGVQSDVFIFALKYFTDQKSGYGISDGLINELPNIIKTSGPTVTLEEAKKEAVEYFKEYKEKKSKPMIQSDYQPELFVEGGVTEMPDKPFKAEKVKEFFEGELPGRIPAEKEKISISDITDQLGALPYPSLNIRPIPYKVKSIDEPLKNVVGTDELRPAMTGIYYDPEHKQKVATNAHILVVIKDKSIVSAKIIDPSTGKEIDARYPNYMAVIPKENPHKIHLTESQVDDLLNQLNGIARAKRFLQEREEPKIVAKIKHQDIEIYVNPVFLIIVLAALKQYGATDIDLEFSTPNRAIMVIDSRKNGNKGLVMPLMFKDDFIYVDVLQNSPVAIQAIPAPVQSESPKEKGKKLRDTIMEMKGSADDKLHYLTQFENKYNLTEGFQKEADKIREDLIKIREKERALKRTPSVIKTPAKTDRKKLNTIHSCAVRLGRRGGLESAKVRAKMHDGGDPDDTEEMPKDSTEYLIDQELKPLIDKVRKKAFMPEYQAGVSDADVLGLIVSKFNRWDGNLIKETCYSAFEDANFNDAAAQVSKFVDGGPTEECGCFSTYLKRENPSLCEKLQTQDVNSNPELRAPG